MTYIIDGADAPQLASPDTLPPARTVRRRWRMLTCALMLLLIPLAGISIWLAIFPPYADAVGGCGGG